MYATLLTLTLGQGMHSAGEKMADQLAPALRAMKGFKAVTYFGDDTTGEYGSFTLWETKEDAEAAAAVIHPKLEKAMSSIAKATQTRRFFEVYETRAQIDAFCLSHILNEYGSLIQLFMMLKIARI